MFLSYPPFQRRKYPINLDIYTLYHHLVHGPDEAGGEDGEDEAGHQLEEDAVEPHGEGEDQLAVQPVVGDLEVIEGVAGLVVPGDVGGGGHDVGGGGHGDEEHVGHGQEEGNHWGQRDNHYLPL